MTSAQDTVGYWFYQLTNAGEFDSLLRSNRLTVEGVPLNAAEHLEQKIGDVLFIWQGGTEAGLRGWGVVASGPELLARTEGSSLGSLAFHLQPLVATPVPRADLVSFPGLSDAPLIRVVSVKWWKSVSAS